MELGRLGPDTESEELIAKREARNRMQAYGAALTAENAALLQKGAKGGKSVSKASRRSEDPASAAAAAREKELQEQSEGLRRAQEYAKQVAERNRKKLASEEGTGGSSPGRGVTKRRGVSPIRTSSTTLSAAGASVARPRRRSGAGASGSGPTAGSGSNHELQRLLAEHDRLAAEVKSFRGQIPRNV